MEKTRKVEISPEEEAVLKKMREDKLKALEEQIAFLKSSLASLNSPKIELPVPTNDSPAEYEKSWYLPQKELFVITRRGKLMTAREVYRAIVAIEPNRADEPGKYEFYTEVSSSLGTSAKQGRYFKRYRPTDADQWGYGAKEWFEGDIPKAQYK